MARKSRIKKQKALLELERQQRASQQTHAQQNAEEVQDDQPGMTIPYENEQERQDYKDLLVQLRNDINSGQEKRIVSFKAEKDPLKTDHAWYLSLHKALAIPKHQGRNEHVDKITEETLEKCLKFLNTYGTQPSDKHIKAKMSIIKVVSLLAVIGMSSLDHIMTMVDLGILKKVFELMNLNQQMKIQCLKFLSVCATHAVWARRKSQRVMILDELLDANIIGKLLDMVYVENAEEKKQENNETKTDDDKKPEEKSDEQKNVDTTITEQEKTTPEEKKEEDKEKAEETKEKKEENKEKVEETKEKKEENKDKKDENKDKKPANSALDKIAEEKKQEQYAVIYYVFSTLKQLLTSPRSKKGVSRVADKFLEHKSLCNAINEAIAVTDFEIQIQVLDFLVKLMQTDKARDTVIQANILEKVISLLQKSKEARVIALSCKVLCACKTSQPTLERLCDDEELLRRLVSLARKPGESNTIKELNFIATTTLATIIPGAADDTVSFLDSLGFVDHILHNVKSSNPSMIFASLVSIRMVGLYADKDAPQIFKKLLDAKVA